MRGLADVANFEELERFSKQKKSPIGYEVEIDEYFNEIAHTCTYQCTHCFIFVLNL